MPATSITCPACSKDNNIALEGVTCRRCGTDLGPVLKVLAAAEATRLLGAAALRASDPQEALAYASQSWELKPDVSTAKLAALACAASRDMEGLAYWRERTR